MTANMPRKRRVGVFLILLSSVISILWGFSLARNTARGMTDFRAVYFGSRCLIENRDPYNEREYLSVFLSEGGEFSQDPSVSKLLRRAIPFCINLPTSLFLCAAFAGLAWGPAHLLWFVLSSVCLVTAACLLWDLAADYAPRAALLLICIVIANCEVLLSSGDLAGFAVSLCIVAVWCFMRERFIAIGIACLSISLVVKPHDAGLVWLFFLLSGFPYRKRALQTLAVTVVLGIAAFLWISHVSPFWVNELRTNLAATAAHGDIRDPGPASASSHELEKVIDLQSVISVFRDDPSFYNPLTFVVCGALLVLWAARTLATHISPTRDWIALAAIVPLTMLITYHRPYDAKLLLLTIPGFAMLWAKNGPIAHIALLVEGAVITLTADIPSAILVILTDKLHVGASGILGTLVTLVLFRSAAIALVAAAFFYLYIYVRQTQGKLDIAKLPAQT